MRGYGATAVKCELVPPFGSTEWGVAVMNVGLLRPLTSRLHPLSERLIIRDAGWVSWCARLEMAASGSVQMTGAGPMIPICEDQEAEGPARAQTTRGPARRARGYPSDLTDAQWQVIAPGLPLTSPRRRGRPPVWPLRRIVEAILYVDRTGCAWRYLPADFPPWRTVYGLFAAAERRHHRPARRPTRAGPAGRRAEHRAHRRGDRLPVRPRGGDRAEGQPGLGQRQESQRPQAPHRRRHHRPAAGSPGHRRLRPGPRRRPAAAVEPARARRRVRRIWADGGYAGKLAAWAATWTSSPWRSSGGASLHTFQVLPRRWVVERTLAWISSTAAAPATTSACPPATKPSSSGP